MNKFLAGVSQEVTARTTLAIEHAQTNSALKEKAATNSCIEETPRDLRVRQ